MIKLLLGFVIGTIFTFYNLPKVEAYFGELDRPDLPNFFSTSQSTATSPERLPQVAYDPALRQATKQAADGMKLITAITMIKTKPPEDQTGEYVIQLISNLANKEPNIARYVHNRMPDGITNREALEIFEKFLSIQG